MGKSLKRTARTQAGAVLLATAGLLAAMPCGAQDAAAQAKPAPAPEPGQVRALLVAEQEATIASQIDKPARVISMPKQVGDAFRAGEVLVAFDCQERQMAVRNFESRYLGARETHLAKLRLQSLGAAADIDVINAAAAAEEVRAQLENAKVLEKQCVITAPYAGKVVRTRARAFEMAKPGDPLLEIVNPASLRIQLFVPSAWFKTIQKGTEFRVTVDETGQSYLAQIIRVSGRIDGSSQTVEVIGRFDSLPANVLPGMIGKAVFPGMR